MLSRNKRQLKVTQLSIKETCLLLAFRVHIGCLFGLLPEVDGVGDAENRSGASIFSDPATSSRLPRNVSPETLKRVSAMKFSIEWPLFVSMAARLGLNILNCWVLLMKRHLSAKIMFQKWTMIASNNLGKRDSKRGRSITSWHRSLTRSAF